MDSIRSTTARTSSGVASCFITIIMSRALLAVAVRNGSSELGLAGALACRRASDDEELLAGAGVGVAVRAEALPRALQDLGEVAAGAVVGGVGQRAEPGGERRAGTAGVRVARL